MKDMEDSDYPSFEDLQRAHAAESKKISDLIAAGYDFKEEMGKSPVMKVFGDNFCKDEIERRRKSANSTAIKKR